MKNQYLTQADFWQERDFGAKITAMFEFIGVHWRALGKCLAYFVPPVALLLGIGLGMLNNATYNRLGALTHGTPAARTAARMAGPGLGVGTGTFVLIVVGALLVGLLVISTVYGYLRARLRLPATEAATPALVWRAMRERMGQVVLAGLLLAGLYLVLMFTLSLVAGFVVALLPSPLVLVPVGLAMLAALAYAGVALSLYFPVLWLEDVSVVQAIGRCFRLVKGSWWATFGLLLVAALLQGVLSIVFFVPQYAVLIGKMFQLPYLDSDALGIAAHALATGGQLFTTPVVLMTAAFQYFNLSEEQESYGLGLLVQGLGQAAPEALSQHYRPEEEQY